MKRVAVLGSTGSIGTQTLEVIDEFFDRFAVHTLAAGGNLSLLKKQIVKYHPLYVYLADSKQIPELEQFCMGHNTQIIKDMSGLTEVMQDDELDIVLAAISGAAGLRPVWAALEAGKDLALANKEVLVAAGDLVVDIVKKKRIRLLPVDSEHSAIFQCLSDDREVEKIIITASGGAFRDKSYEELKEATPALALAHPNWNMGKKITIDSATLANKGLEVIEAHFLFDIPYENIDVVVHRESIVHSMVQFIDGSVIAQLGLPDMKLPIQYAFSHPKSWKNTAKRLDLTEIGRLTFEKPRYEDFPALKLAYKAGEIGGLAPCTYNAANEKAVELFLREEITFLEIPKIIEEALEHFDGKRALNLDDVLDRDLEVRKFVAERYQR